MNAGGYKQSRRSEIKKVWELERDKKQCSQIGDSEKAKKWRNQQRKDRRKIKKAKNNVLQKCNGMTCIPLPFAESFRIKKG